MASETPYPNLFSPLDLAGRRLRNRIVHASITTSLSQGGQVTERHTRYFANRARGGCAMIVTEPLAMAKHQTTPHKVNARDDTNLDGLRRWAEAVEGAGCRLVAQVQDPGRGRHAPGRNPEAVGASALPDDISWTMPHVLTTAEIARMIEGFAEAARRVMRCGFSGVEISAGHGHLFHQFMSPWSNVRDDAYGGDFEGRMRLVVELIAAIRAACGSGFILGVKSPGDDGVPGGIGPALAADIARRIAATGQVDYLCFAQGSHHRTLEMHTPDAHAPPLTYLELTRRLRREVPGVPVMALGRITDPAEAEAILARGDAELVGLGRPLITDPAWPMKAAEGRARDIRYCVSGNSCWQAVISYRPIACDNNPRVAAPDELARPALARARKRVVVVGAGIAGLEAAWVAAARGHEVTVFGRSAEPGGKARLLAQLPGGEQVSSIYDYQVTEAQRSGVRFELGVEASAADVTALAPEAVVLATGARMTWPRCLPAALREEGVVPDLRSAIADLLHHRERQRGAAVLFDMDHTDGTYAAAELLHRLFDRVVVITPRESIAQDTYLVTRQGILRRFHALGIEMIPFAEPRWSEAFEREDRLDHANVYTGKLGSVADVAFLAYSTPRAPEDGLASELMAAGLALQCIGDARVARDAMAATAEGHAAGAAL
jgi:2,4-dienoyl-CoA reductase-like NADH-dependent reductase (Old Yellow Enzyme family)/threonine dehydrogenase-like Zn-dependent dehydrogenase